MLINVVETEKHILHGMNKVHPLQKLLVGRSEHTLHAPLLESLSSFHGVCTLGRIHTEWRKRKGVTGLLARAIIVYVETDIIASHTLCFALVIISTIY